MNDTCVLQHLSGENTNPWFERREGQGTKDEDGIEAGVPCQIKMITIS